MIERNIPGASNLRLPREARRAVVLLIGTDV